MRRGESKIGLDYWLPIYLFRRAPSKRVGRGRDARLFTGDKRRRGGLVSSRLETKEQSPIDYPRGNPAASSRTRAPRKVQAGHAPEGSFLSRALDGARPVVSFGRLVSYCAVADTTLSVPASRVPAGSCMRKRRDARRPTTLMSTRIKKSPLRLRRWFLRRISSPLHPALSGSSKFALKRRNVAKMPRRSYKAARASERY